MGEGAQQEDELPALVLGQAVLEGGHGAAALGNLVEHLAVSHVGHVNGVGQVRWRRAVHPGLGAVAFAGLAVALCAVFAVKLAGRVLIRRGRDEGVFESFVFGGNQPGLALLRGPIEHQDANGDEKRGKKDFGKRATPWTVAGHEREKFSHIGSEAGRKEPASGGFFRRRPG